jgi:hypothetical protein
MDEPYTRQLPGKLRELRFHLAQQAVRISYRIAANRRIILLTVLRKQRMSEDAEGTAGLPGDAAVHHRGAYGG